MPRFDRTGPTGAGPQTGRKMGPCNDNKDTVDGQGSGMGRGMGMGMGFGRRFGGWFRRIFGQGTK